MKTIGLLGGMSWESSLLYYRIVNEETNRILGGQNNAKSIIYTVNFQEIEQLQHLGDWDAATKILIDASVGLEQAGADFVVICTNTMHKVLPQIRQAAKLPFLHIAKATANRIKQTGITRVGLLGTKFTMQEEFYRQVITDEDIEVVVPAPHDMDIVHDIIYNELCLGEISSSSKSQYLEIIDKMDNIDGVILGCTEIGLLLSQKDLDIKVFDTTEIHAKEAVRMALQID